MKHKIRELLNKTERDVYEDLKSICSRNDCVIFPKVRIADVLLIDYSGLNTKLYDYALRAHFDFVICNSNSLALFAVEFDGPTHNSTEQKYKDSMKDKICSYFKFPILRVSSNYNDTLSNDFNLLSWLVEYYFACTNFPIDKTFNPNEIVTPSLIYSISGYDTKYPLCPSFKIRKKLFNMHLSDTICSSSPRIITYIDPYDNSYKSLGFIEVFEGTFAISTLSLKNTFFFDLELISSFSKNLSFSELLNELTVIDLFSKVRYILDNANIDSNISSLETLKVNYDKSFKFIASF
ncbi:MAG: DUF2726 domain-containing protein [Paraclostridium sp.]